MNRDAWEAAIGDALERGLSRRPDARACYDRDGDFRLMLSVAGDVLTAVAMSAEQTVHIPRDGVRQLLNDTMRRLIDDGADAARERQRLQAIAGQQLQTMTSSATVDGGGLMTVRSERPFCRWCQQVIHRDSEGWRHAGSARIRCADLQHVAEPDVAQTSVSPPGASSL